MVEAAKLRTKILVSSLPHEMNEEKFIESIAEWVGKYNYLDFYQGKRSIKKKETGRAYINFLDADIMQQFVKKMQGQPFIDERGATHKLCIEYAPSQSVPSDFQKKKNPREGTIEKDADYLAFVASLGKPKETSTGDNQTEKRTTDEKPQEEAIISPLLLELKIINERKAKKNQRKRQKKILQQNSKANANSNANKGKGPKNGGKANAGNKGNKNDSNNGDTASGPPNKKYKNRRRNRNNKGKQAQAQSQLVPGSIKIQQKPGL